MRIMESDCDLNIKLGVIFNLGLGFVLIIMYTNNRGGYIYNNTISATHKQQLELAARVRSEGAAHHHARVAASQSRVANTKPSLARWTALDMGGMRIAALDPAVFAYTFLTVLYPFAD